VRDLKGENLHIEVKKLVWELGRDRKSDD